MDKRTHPKFEYNVDHIKSAVTKERLGGLAFINLASNGETLLADESIELITAFLELGHIVQIISNGTLTEKINMLTELPDEYKSRLIFMNSFHYLEFKRLNMLGTVFSNLNNMKNAGISTAMLMTLNKEYIPYLEEIKNSCIENFGVVPKIQLSYELKGNEWTVEEFYSQDIAKMVEKLFDAKEIAINDTYLYGVKRTEFCYAGDWSFCLNLVNGDISSCPGSQVYQNIFKDLNQPIKFEPVAKNCHADYCSCGNVLQSLGITPDLTYYPNYFEMFLENGYYSETIKSALSKKLYTTNKEYSDTDKEEIDKKVKQQKQRKRNSSIFDYILRKLKK